MRRLRLDRMIRRLFRAIGIRQLLYGIFQMLNFFINLYFKGEKIYGYLSWEGWSYHLYLLSSYYWVALCGGYKRKFIYLSLKILKNLNLSKKKY